MRFHHAGLATNDLDAIAATYVDLLGAASVHEERLEQLRVRFLDLGNGYLELLEPLQPEGPIARYLEGHGAGIHHLALATPDIGDALATARSLGITAIDDEPRPGAWGHEVAFLHPDDTGGALIEFVAD